MARQWATARVNRVLKLVGNVVSELEKEAIIYWRRAPKQISRLAPPPCLLERMCFSLRFSPRFLPCPPLPASFRPLDSEGHGARLGKGGRAQAGERRGHRRRHATTDWGCVKSESSFLLSSDSQGA